MESRSFPSEKPYSPGMLTCAHDMGEAARCAEPDFPDLKALGCRAGPGTSGSVAWQPVTFGWTDA